MVNSDPIICNRNDSVIDFPLYSDMNGAFLFDMLLRY